MPDDKSTLEKYFVKEETEEEKAQSEAQKYLGETEALSTEKRQFECPICKATFDTSEMLLNHIVRKHKGCTYVAGMAVCRGDKVVVHIGKKAFRGIVIQAGKYVILLEAEDRNIAINIPKVLAVEKLK